MYIELHARSAFSFLEGAALPEQLAERCTEVQMPAIGLLDRDGVYGSARMHLAARDAEIKADVGAEVTLANSLLKGVARDVRYPLLVETQAGYQNLCRLMRWKSFLSSWSTFLLLPVRPRAKWRPVSGHCDRKEV